MGSGQSARAVKKNVKSIEIEGNDPEVDDAQTLNAQRRLIMQSGQNVKKIRLMTSVGWGFYSIQNTVKVIEEKHLDHPKADDVQTLQAAQQEVRSLRALVLQMSEVMKAQHDKVLCCG